MAYTTTPYCSLDDVHSVLGIPTADIDDDTWIENTLIPDAQDFIDSYIGYSFQTDGPGSTRVYDGNGLGRLITGEYITAFTQVLETTFDVVLGSGDIFTINTTKTVDITQDCFLGPPNKSYGYYLQRVSQLPFVQGTQNYKITGTFGRTPIPAKISRACARLAAHYYKMRDTNYADTITEQNSVRMRYKKEAPIDICEILEQHRRRAFFSGNTSYGRPF